MANQNLQGGRAYYTGKNAYASQAFELDTRRQIQALQNEITTLQNALASFQPVRGVTNGSNALAGNIGEYIESLVAENTIGGWVNGVPKNITSISLTPGDWDVDGIFQFGNGPITGIEILGGTTLTSATFTSPTIYVASQGQTPAAGVDLRVTIPIRRFALMAITTIFLVARIGFSTGTPLAGGLLRARRVR